MVQLLKTEQEVIDFIGRKDMQIEYMISTNEYRIYHADCHVANTTKAIFNKFMEEAINE